MKFVSKYIENDMYYGTLERLPEKIFEPNTIYYYDRLERVRFGTTLSDFIEQKHFDHISKDETSFILVNYQDDYFNVYDATHWSDAIKSNSICPSNYVFVVKDMAFKNFLENVFKKNSISPLPKITILDQLKLNVLFPESKPEKITHKFSGLSRCWQPWRGFIFSKLFEKNCLKDFIFSFHNMNPYMNKVFDYYDMLSDMGSEWSPDGSGFEFLRQVPVELDKGGLKPKYSNITYDAIQSADFHLLIESHFVQNESIYELVHPRLPNIKEMPMEEIAPAFFTEKTYKSIVCKKPFIACSTPHFIKEFKKLGYRSFAPWIDESYDAIEDHRERAIAITEEVNRIINLSETEYKKIVKGCQEICEHNLNLLVEENFTVSQQYYKDFPQLLPHLRMVANGYWDEKNPDFDNSKHHFMTHSFLSY